MVQTALGKPSHVRPNSCLSVLFGTLFGDKENCQIPCHSPRRQSRWSAGITSLQTLHIPIMMFLFSNTGVSVAASTELGDRNTTLAWSWAANLKEIPYLEAEEVNLYHHHHHPQQTHKNYFQFISFSAQHSLSLSLFINSWEFSNKEISGKNFVFSPWF